MEGYKNIKSISEVKEVLEKFQELYSKKDISSVDEYVNNGFSLKDGLVVLGNGMNQWCLNTEDIKTIIKAHLSNENNYWKEINFKFDEAKIFANENTAWVVSIGNIKNTISEEKQIQDTIEKVKEILGGEEKSNTNALDAARKIANIIRNIEQGEIYLWPLRFTSVLIKENDTWKFHQMQFTFDTASWSHRITDENYDRGIFEMPEVNLKEDHEEVRKTLQAFQDGYTKRDINYVDEYMKEVFLLDEDLVVLGTCADELCLGINAVRGIIESDWKYWGDFEFNLENPILSVNEDVAYFTTKAILRRVVPSEQVLKWISGSAEYTFKSEQAPKRKLMEVLCDTVDYLYESERGDIFITPMRFSGVLVKKDGKWLIQHLQYSDYIDGMPDVRKDL